MPPSPLSSLRVLLVQARPDEMKEHEYHCVLQTSGLRPDQVVIHDALTQPYADTILDHLDAVLIGGSGDYCASKVEMPHQLELEAFVRRVRERDVPLLGICFGAHIMVRAFGGEVVHDVLRQESETTRIFVDDAGRRDPVFGPMPATFYAQTSHKDHQDVLPSGAVRLASTPVSRNQAWTIPGEPVYAIQFHVELDQKTLTERFDFYRAKYFPTEESYDAALSRLKPSPVAPRLLRIFLQAVVCEKKTYPFRTS